MVNQLRNFFNYIAEQLKKFRRRLTKRRLSPPVILLPSLHGFEDLLLFNLCPCSPGQARLKDTAHLPGRQVQGFILERVQCLDLPVDLFSPSTVLAWFQWGCGRGIDPFLLGYTLYYSPRREGFPQQCFFLLYKISWDKQKPGIW